MKDILIWCEKHIGLETPIDYEYGRVAVNFDFRWGHSTKFVDLVGSKLVFDYYFDFHREEDCVLFKMTWG